jgi:TetR/AcrR family transcriptional regulator, transcriptional repressor for nem operon
MLATIMKKNPERTHTLILDHAETLVYEHGFSGTTVDAVIKAAGVSKGAFFHHFSSKSDLGHQMVRRHAEADLRHLEENYKKAAGLSDNPLQQLLIFVKLFEQETAALKAPYPGCLYAASVQQAGLFSDEVKKIVSESFLKWRKVIRDKLAEISEIYPPKQPVDLEDLADMFIVLFEGAIILSQSLDQANALARQISLYHSYLKLLFEK